MKIMLRLLFWGIVIVSCVSIFSYFQSKRDIHIEITEDELKTYEMQYETENQPEALEGKG